MGKMRSAPAFCGYHHHYYHHYQHVKCSSNVQHSSRRNAFKDGQPTTTITVAAGNRGESPEETSKRNLIEGTTDFSSLCLHASRTPTTSADYFY